MCNVKGVAPKGNLKEFITQLCSFAQQFLMSLI